MLEHLAERDSVCLDQLSGLKDRAPVIAGWRGE